MKLIPFFKKQPSVGVAVFGMFICCFIAATTPGCATKTQVEEIVASSNAALLSDSLTDPLEVNNALTPGKHPVAVGSVIPAWQTASVKIEQFAVAHAEQTTTLSALRLRQAIMLLANNQFESARFAFDQATDLHADRDIALKALSNDLIWWFGLDKGFETTPSFTSAEQALNNFQAQIDKLSKNPKNDGIRDYLAEMRVWIALHYVKNETSAIEIKRIMELTFNDYAKIFTEEDLAAIKNSTIGSSKDPLGVKVRRQTRAKEVIAAAKKRATSLQAHGVAIELDASAREFQEMISPG